MPVANLKPGLLTAEEFAAEWTPRGEAESRLALGSWDELSALAAEDIPTPPAVVDGLIRRGEKAILGGASKSYKSWAALDLGVSVASRSPWLGRGTSGGRVLIVNLELPRWCVRRRLIEIAQARGVDLDLIRDQLHVWTLRGENPTAEEVRAAINAKGFEDLAIVILDPVYRLLAGRDENSAGDIGGLLATLGGIPADTGAALVLPAHFAKGNSASKDAMDRISGSGVFARDPDSLLTITRHAEDGAFTVESVLRTFPPVDPFVIRWQHPVFIVDGGLDPAQLRQVRKPGPTPRCSAEQLLTLLPADGLAKPAWRKAADDAYGCGKTAFYDMARELEASNRVQVRDGLLIRVQDAKASHAD